MIKNFVNKRWSIKHIERFSIYLFGFLMLVTPFSIGALQVANNSDMTILSVWGLLPFLLLYPPTLSFSLYLTRVIKSDASTKTIFLVWLKNALRFYEETISYLQKYIVELLVFVVMSISLVYMFGAFVIWLFTLPGGLIGLMVTYLINYSTLTDQADFNTIYAVFSSAVTMLSMIVAAMLMLLMKVDNGLLGGNEAFALDEEEGSEKIVVELSKVVEKQTSRNPSQLVPHVEENKPNEKNFRHHSGA